VCSVHRLDAEISDRYILIESDDSIVARTISTSLLTGIKTKYGGNAQEVWELDLSGVGSSFCQHTVVFRAAQVRWDANGL
jgi:hypothetical protein